MPSLRFVKDKDGNLTTCSPGGGRVPQDNPVETSIDKPAAKVVMRKAKTLNEYPHCSICGSPMAMDICPEGTTLIEGKYVKAEYPEYGEDHCIKCSKEMNDIRVQSISVPLCINCNSAKADLYCEKCKRASYEDGNDPLPGLCIPSAWSMVEKKAFIEDLKKDQKFALIKDLKKKKKKK